MSSSKRNLTEKNNKEVSTKENEMLLLKDIKINFQKTNRDMCKHK